MMLNICKTVMGRKTVLNYNIVRGKKYMFKRSTLDQEWRDKRGLPENPNRFGPLTNLPDYTFLDGRPTPLGFRQRERVALQREIAKKIVTLSEEMNFAVERYEKKKQDEEKHRSTIIQNKLKPKGSTSF